MGNVSSSSDDDSSAASSDLMLSRQDQRMAQRHHPVPTSISQQQKGSKKAGNRSKKRQSTSAQPSLAGRPSQKKGCKGTAADADPQQAPPAPALTWIPGNQQSIVEYLQANFVSCKDSVEIAEEGNDVYHSNSRMLGKSRVLAICGIPIKLITGETFRVFMPVTCIPNWHSRKLMNEAKAAGIKEKTRFCNMLVDKHLEELADAETTALLRDGNGAPFGDPFGAPLAAPFGAPLAAAAAAADGSGALLDSPHFNA